ARKARAGKTVFTVQGEAKAYHTPLVRFPKQRLKPGKYFYEVTLRSKANANRTSTFTSPTFAVGN
ncbi:MAG TPA: hypothetical protein VNT23_08985, partial [Gaiellaceae bacterium]|nr:hypothetical protein [Gaiellaceae bacterium]